MPDDLAILTSLQVPASTQYEMLGLKGFVGNIEGMDGGIEREAEQAVGSNTSSTSDTISLGGLISESSYQVSFSQHYRQQLLACF
ncbi:hypothetical protein [Pseudomonas sp.]|uniref:hypothetical protein n=1 Tax=Pseudomonas sp. TaxID=306 RepID=UPI003264EA43